MGKRSSVLWAQPHVGLGMTEFWAKTGEGDAWLSLDRHLDDVAAVAERLWDVGLTARQRAWVSAACGVDEPTTRAWWTFLAGIHDVGKASPAFQGLVPGLARRVLPPGLSLPARPGKPPRHDAVSGAILVGWGQGWAPQVPEREWLVIAATIAGHHGVLRSRRTLREARRQVLRPAPEWAPLQHAILDARASRLGLSPDAVPRLTNRAAVLALAGLLTVSDWVGSGQRLFPVTVEDDRAPSAAIARMAVHPDTWAAPRAPAQRTFTDLFAGPDGRPRAPRASQQAVIEALDERGEPSLLIVEDRTGSGKTEAALWVAYRGLQNGSRGLYVGMPTRATANQLHGRTEAFLRRALDDGQTRTRLLHSGIEAADAASDDVAPATSENDGDDGRREAVDAWAWFVDRRRGLLERYGVGTIDQALLAVLTARHFTVRLWGLQGKVVIFDEVHAYDAYTGALLERAIEWLAALDCPIVLLSATLPPRRRGKLVAAYRRGRAAVRGDRHDSPDVTDAAPLPAVPYPRLTVAHEDGAEVIAVDDPRPSRAVSLDRLTIDEQDDGAAIADRVAAEIDDGGCVAVVCNTVGLAQRRYAALRERLGDDVEILLVHARLRPVEREPLEARLLAALGAGASRGDGRPERLVVVATQVIEQSLDVDFDVAFTDIAPIDLLVQRAGRVHRHPRVDGQGRSTRPARHAAPRLVVLDTAGMAITRPYARGIDHVYVAAVLHRTRHLLVSRQTITEPDDLDGMIRAVYEQTPELGDEDAVALRQADERLASDLRARRADAKWSLVPAPDAEDPPWEHEQPPLADADAPGATARNAAATRWITEPTVGVIVLGPDELRDAWIAPSPDDARALLRRAVTLRADPLGVKLGSPGRGAGSGLPGQPPGWREHPLLRHHLLVRTDADGWAQPPDHDPDAGALPLRWTPIGGATIQRPTKEPTCASI